MIRTAVSSVLRVALLLLVAAAPASAQNLLINPDFDSNLTGWQDLSATASHDNAVGASSGPGSALWDVTIASDAEGEDLVVVSQCVEDIIVAGQTYEFGGAIAINDAPAGGSALLAAQFFADSDCSGLALEGVLAAPVTDVGPFENTGGTAIAPPGAGSVIVGVLSGVGAVGPGPVPPSQPDPLPGDYSVHVDDMFLVVQGAVPTAGWPWIAALALMLLLVARASVARRRLTTTS